MFDGVTSLEASFLPKSMLLRLGHQNLDNKCWAGEGKTWPSWRSQWKRRSWRGGPYQSVFSSPLLCSCFSTICGLHPSALSLNIRATLLFKLLFVCVGGNKIGSFFGRKVWWWTRLETMLYAQTFHLRQSPLEDVAAKENRCRPCSSFSRYSIQPRFWQVGTGCQTSGKQICTCCEVLSPLSSVRF